MKLWRYGFVPNYNANEFFLETHFENSHHSIFKNKSNVGQKVHDLNCAWARSRN